MYSSLKLENFRGFKTFGMDLKPMTLISGQNNVGKTALLESIFLFHDYAEPQVFLKLHGFRGVRTPYVLMKSMWEPLFYNGDMSVPISIDLGDNNAISLTKNDSFVTSNNAAIGSITGNDAPSTTNYALTCIFKSGNHDFTGDYVLVDGNLMLVGSDDSRIRPNAKHIQYMGPSITLTENEVVENFGQLELNNGKDRLVKILRILDESILDLTTIVAGGSVTLYITKNNGIRLPLHVIGDGAKKLLNIALLMLTKPGCILLLDEVENGFHYSLIPKLWEVIATLTNTEKCQVIATTHSYECISGAAEGVKAAGLQDAFSFVRLEKSHENQVSPKQFTHDMLENAVSTDWEVR